MNKWINKFHNTEKLSPLDQIQITDIKWQVSEKILSKRSIQYKLVRELEKMLCPHRNKNCACTTYNEIKEYDTCLP